MQQDRERERLRENETEKIEIETHNRDNYTLIAALLPPIDKSYMTVCMCVCPFVCVRNIYGVWK